MFALLKKIDQKCEEHVELLILLLSVVILRIPSLFEPYWYGDEGIYLTIGTGLKQGLRLYTDIIDHKTPLIYYLAMVPNQFWFRVLTLGWMMAATAFFFFFTKKLFGRVREAFASTAIFVLLTTLPWFEGNIPNGELFVIGFVTAGLWLLSKTQLFQNFLAGNFQESLQVSARENKLLIAVGALFSLGVLTKVPSLLDFGAVLLIGWYATLQLNFQQFGQFLKKTSWLMVGLLFPIALSIAYFVGRGSGQDYLNYGLLYNLRYSTEWQLAFTNPLTQFLFTLPGKALVLAGILALLSFVKKYSPRFQFIASWFVLALFAVMLSNRPYPHYFMQAVPAFSLLVVQLWLTFENWSRAKTAALTGFAILILPVFLFVLLQVRPYSSLSYYQHFFDFATKKISMTEYYNAFNPLVEDNYAAAEVIHGLNGQRIFIWGTNPMLYAQTHTTPTSRFTVAFHIKDFNDYQRTFSQIKQEKPKIIVVMKNETDPFPQLQQYLDNFYSANSQYATMTVYLRQTP